MGFHIIDLPIGSLPFFFCAEALDPLHHHSAVPGSVKNRDMAVFWHGLPESPEIMMAFLRRGGRSCRTYQISSGIHWFCKPFDSAPFSSGVPAFESQDHRDPLTVQFTVKDLHTILKLFQFFLILFFCISKRQVYFAQYRRIQLLIFLGLPGRLFFLHPFLFFCQSQFFSLSRYLF